MWMIAALACLPLLVTVGGREPPAPGPGTWPVASRVLLSGFRPPVHDWQAGHRGVDLRATPGEPVRAAGSGRTGFVGTVAGKPVVTIDLPDGRRLTYEPVLTDLPRGSPVLQGQVIGTVAAAGGHCGGHGCLHVGLVEGGEYTDPLRLLGRPFPVLKPVRP